MQRKGSMTVEASFIIPLSFFAVMMFINLFLFLQVQIRVQEEITSMGTELMALGTIMNEANLQAEETETLAEQYGVADLIRQVGTDAYLSARMYSRLSKEQWLSHVVNGAKGFSFQGSEAYENGETEIRILVSYSFCMTNSLFDLGGIPVKQQVVARGFSGMNREKVRQNEADEEEKSDQVYVTENGKVFHRSKECTYLKPSIRSTTVNEVDKERNSSGAKYYPCEMCGGNGSNDVCYITDYGTRYHTTLSCPELLRVITAMTEEEARAKGLRPCSKCGEGTP